jgi:hypothetical protein
MIKLCLGKQWILNPLILHKQEHSLKKSKFMEETFQMAQPLIQSKYLSVGALLLL